MPKTPVMPREAEPQQHAQQNPHIYEGKIRQ